MSAEETARKLEDELNEAERQAWNALARYKFQMFGYWAAIWVHLNRIGGFKRKNPFSQLVKQAREVSPVEPGPRQPEQPLLAHAGGAGQG